MKYYMVIIAPRPSELSDAVSSAIQEGWELWGNPFWAGENYCQAVVRFARTNNKVDTKTITAVPIPGYTVGAPG